MNLFSITYLGQEYDLQHLIQKDFICEWKNNSKNIIEKFSVRVNYSNHCYSEEVKKSQPSDVIISQNPLRVFCPIRYRESISLPSIIAGLFDKMTSRVILTHVGNYHIYHLYTRLDPNGERRYCIFFSLKIQHSVLPNGHIPVNLYVESAYIRDDKVSAKRSRSFGVFLSETLK